MKRRMFAPWGAGIVCALLAACGSSGAAGAPPPVPPATTSPGAATPAEALSPRPAGGTLPGGTRPAALSADDTVAFCKPIEGVELLMDVYYPEGHSEGSDTPAVVYVHGGGWTSGSRTSGEGARYIPSLVANGFVVFAVDYRLSPEYLFPAHIQDVQCAVRHIRANANEYGIDSDRIGAIGGSAGGQLVNLLGTAEDGDFELAGGYEAFSSQVSAVVTLYGPSDFSDPNMTNHNDNHTRVFGDSDPGSEALAAASAVNYVDAGDAAFLLLHGEEDPVVPISQSEIFEAALSHAGVHVALVRVQNAGHSFVPVGGTPSPGNNELVQTAVAFFLERL